MTASLAGLLEYLEPAERKELDAHLIALSTGQPHTEYQRDPIRWAVEKLGVPRHTLVWSELPGYDAHVWDGTPDPLAKMFEAIADWKDAGIESATGTGKSYGAAILIYWFLACFENAQVFTFAPKEDQLKLYIWRYLGELWPKFAVHFPKATIIDLAIRMRGGLDESWAAHGYAVGVKAGEQVSTKASGMHAQHQLLIYEEMPGVPEPVVLAGENTSTAPHNLRLGLGNPQHQLDTLHKFCTSPGVVHIRASGLDHPNVVTGNPDLIPGAVAAPSIQKRRARFGETSPVYQSRVRGVSPDQASDALIRLVWLEQSAARWEHKQRTGTMPRRLTGKGVDVANSEHGDRACIADWADNVLVRLSAFQCPDANALGRSVSMEMDGAELPQIRCGVDTIGVGAGTFNELSRLRKHVVPMVASAKPAQRQERAPDGGTFEWSSDGNKFRHARDQWYWQLREDLRLGRIDIQRDTELWEELLAPTFVDEPLVIIEPKDEIKERLGRSPDKADAVVMGNWVRERKGPTWNDDPDGRPHADPHMALRTKDGKPPVWIGPEDRQNEDRGGFAEQYPVDF